MHRDMGQPSLAEAVVAETLGHNQRLERIDDAVDWDRLGRVVAGVHVAPRGWPSNPPLLMVKVLLLQQWRGARSHFGYQVHLGVDEDTLLVRRAVLPPANVYESEGADPLVSGDERAVYGDRAYASQRRRQWLRAQGIPRRPARPPHGPPGGADAPPHALQPQLFKGLLSRE